jgi:uncharacterized protein (DUF1697 family)
LEKYIALLRGINISGNFLFSGNISYKNELINRCKSIIKERFMLNIPVAIISLKELSESLNNAPEWWVTNLTVTLDRLTMSGYYPTKSHALKADINT